MQAWVLLHYKIPREPTAPRVSAWRKLKRLGAILLQDAVWVLPATPHTREDFQWLAAEIGDQPIAVASGDGRVVPIQHHRLTSRS